METTRAGKDLVASGPLHGFARLLARPWGGALLQATLFTVLATPTVVASFDPRGINHDITWFLHCAGQLLDGGRAYVDFIETNPPLIVWLAIPPVWVARLTGLPEILVYHLFVLVLVAGTLLAVSRLLAAAWGTDSVERRHVTLLLLATPLLLAPGYDFGQRDHLTVILLLPFLVATAGWLGGRPPAPGLRWFCGFWAAPALAIKPHFLLVWAAVEATRWWSERGRAPWRRPENWAIGGSLVAYAVSVPLFAPVYLKVIRWSLEAYGAFAEPVPMHVHLTVAYAGLAAFLLVRSGPATRVLRRIVCVALVAFVAVAFLQQRGFPYHFVPATVMGWFSLGLAALAMLEQRGAWTQLLRLPPAAFAPALAALVLLLGGAHVWTAVDRGFISRPISLVTELVRVVEKAAPAGSIVAYSTEIYPGFPLASITGVEWSSRFGHLWLIPGSYTELEKRTQPFPYHDPDAMGPLERFGLDAVVEDLEANLPTLIIFDRSSKKQGFGRETAFDFEEYLAQDPRFADILSDYRLYADVAEFRVFRRVRSR